MYPLATTGWLGTQTVEMLISRVTLKSFKKVKHIIMDYANVIFYPSIPII